MPDYKEMYLKMFRATEKALDIIIAAQRECEELYLDGPSRGFPVLDASAKDPVGDETEPQAGK